MQIDPETGKVKINRFYRESVYGKKKKTNPQMLGVLDSLSVLLSTK